MYDLKNFTKLGRKIIGIGRNYKRVLIDQLLTFTFFNFNRAHAKELGNAIPTKPLLFLKPTTSYIVDGQSIEIPDGCSRCDHEVELGVIIKKTCKGIGESEAMDYVGGYTLALDMTCRDFQEEAKRNGHPWTMAKGFDTSCPVGEFIPKDVIQDPHNLQLLCHVNQRVRQDGNTQDMIFSIPSLLSYISRYFTLEEGDLILTGTPAGVGPVQPGDKITASIPEIASISFPVIQKQ